MKSIAKRIVLRRQGMDELPFTVERVKFNHLARGEHFYSSTGELCMKIDGAIVNTFCKNPACASTGARYRCTPYENFVDVRRGPYSPVRMDRCITLKTN